ncbi:MAG: adenylate kinase [Ruminococcaceae bacterium]|nr:adenylate kinase [Oscillospiraceae bacterium]
MGKGRSKIVMLGAPGSGKGTRAKIISERLSIPVISTGEILREEIHKGTDLGKQVKSDLDSGKLVSDETINGILKKRLSMPDCENGFILDGVPRTLTQAKYLESMGIDIDYAVSVEIEDEKIVDRLAGRRVCPNCGRGYHTDMFADSSDELCEDCGCKLAKRKDDEEETVRERLRVYYELTEPLKDYYEQSNKLIKVSGDDKLSEIAKNVLRAMGLD